MPEPMSEQDKADFLFGQLSAAFLIGDLDDARQYIADYREASYAKGVEEGRRLALQEAASRKEASMYDTYHEAVFGLLAEPWERVNP